MAADRADSVQTKQTDVVRAERSGERERGGGERERERVEYHSLARLGPGWLWLGVGLSKKQSTSLTLFEVVAKLAMEI